VTSFDRNRWIGKDGKTVKECFPSSDLNFVETNQEQIITNV
jgi:hypothetical protein